MTLRALLKTIHLFRLFLLFRIICYTESTNYERSILVMSTLTSEKNIALPTSQEVLLAEESYRKLSAYMQSIEEPIVIQLKKGNESVLLPPSALQFLITILSQMARGNTVTIVPVHAELTTQEAADLLDVSRPFLINSLLKKGEIPFRKVGSRRRVLAKDVLKYKQEIDKKRLADLDELAKEAQKHDMGY